MLDKDTKQTIDNARDILVGKVPNPVTQIDLITTAMIYKFMDDMDLENISLGGKRVFFVGDLEQYAWSKLLSATVGNSERINLYTQALEKLPYAKQIPQLFRSIFKDAFLPFRDGATLTLFLNEINSLSYDNSENLGDGFEYLLSVMGSQGDAGQFRTPRHIIDFIVEVVNPTKNDAILDPACGTAGFLISAYKHIIKTANEQKKPLSVDAIKQIAQNIMGYDIDPTMQKLSLVNLYLHKFATPKVYEYDTLTSEDRWGDKFDVILANPPFMTPKGGIRPHNRFGIKANKSEVLFVDYFMEHLTLNGRAGFVVPEGIIFQSATAYKNLRKMMVEDNYLYAVVSLPAGVFNPYSGVKTSILFFDRQLAKKTDKILFVEVKNDGFDLGAQRRPIKENDLPSALQAIQKYQKSYNKKDLKLPDNCLLVEKSKIAENGDYNLTASRYKPTTQTLNSKWEMVRLGDEVETIGGLWVGKKGPYKLVKVIRNTNFTKNGYLDFSNVAQINVEFKQFEKRKLVKGDIIIEKSGGSDTQPVGRVVIFNEDAEDFSFSNFTNLIRVTNKNRLKPEYLHKVLHGIYLMGITEKYQTHTGGIRNLHLSEYLDIKIPLPPLEVQEEIVKELERYQAIIDGSQDVIDNWKPYFAIKPNWPKVKLGEVCKIKGGYAFKSSDFVNKGIQVIKMGNVKPFFFDVLNAPSFLPVEVKDKYHNFVISKGDILISMTGTIGKTDYGNVCMIDKEGDFLLNQRVGKFEIDKSKIYSEFMYYLANMDEFKAQIFQNSSGGIRQANISASGIESIFIPLPPLDEQKTIVEKIKREEQYINTCKEYIAHFKQKIADKIQSIWSSK